MAVCACRTRWTRRWRGYVAFKRTELYNYRQVISAWEREHLLLRA